MKRLKMVMMVTLMMCLSLISISQIDSIKLTKNGLTNVTIKTKLTRDIEYERTLKWVNDTYKNPESVLSGKKVNEYVIISGYSSNAFNVTILGMYNTYSLTYHINIIILDSSIVFKFIADEYRCTSIANSPSSNFDFGACFKSDGTYKKQRGNLKQSLENTINSLLFSYYSKLNDNSMTSDEALIKLKKYKDKLELGLITQEEYDQAKLELAIFIK
jgi:hypothetical protein